MKIGNDDLARKRINRLHFIGIGGAGMGGIAEVVANLGYKVSGSDVAEGAMTRRLQSLGITVYKGHAAENVEGADVIVVSTAIDSTLTQKSWRHAKSVCRLCAVRKCWRN